MKEADSMNADKNREVIYWVNGKPLTYGTFVDACRAVALCTGDTIFLHSDLLSLGELIMEDSLTTLALFVSALQEAVGAEGTLIMPTFTYSFLNETWSGPFEDFDVDHSPSKTGVLTEYFRKQPDVIRTDHPTHSVAIWGKEKAYYANVGDTTFGKDSIFGKLLAQNAKIVCLGFPAAGTFAHFIEKQASVPYRSEKTLAGRVVRNGKAYQKEITFYLRKRGYDSRFKRFEDHLRSTDKVKLAPLGNSELSAIDTRTLFEEGIQLLKQNPYYLVKKKTLIDKSVSRLKSAIKAILRM